MKLICIGIAINRFKDLISLFVSIMAVLREDKNVCVISKKYKRRVFVGIIEVIYVYEKEKGSYWQFITI